jgi:hypothetical protein
VVVIKPSGKIQNIFFFIFYSLLQDVAVFYCRLHEAGIIILKYRKAKNRFPLTSALAPAALAQGPLRSLERRRPTPVWLPARLAPYLKAICSVGWVQKLIIEVMCD